MSLPGGALVKPSTLIKGAEEFVEESNKVAAGAKATLAEANNLNLGQLIDVPQPALRQEVSAAQNLQLHEKYPDFIARTRNVIDSPAPGLGAASQDLRPARRLTPGARGRGWSQLADDAIRSAALTVDKLAAGRVLAELSADTLRQFADAARVQMIANSRAYARALIDMRSGLMKTLKTRRLNLKLTTVTTAEGVWWFARREGNAAEILGEIFVPRTAGAAVPKRPPIPKASQPRWLQADGTFTAQPPVGEPLHRPLNLSPELIDKGPEALVEQMKRAQKGKISGSSEPVFEQPRQTNLSPAEQQVAGNAIRDMEKQSLRNLKSEFEAQRLNADTVTTLKGSVGKLALRLADQPLAVEFDAASLEKIREAFGSNYQPPFNQLHAWGRVLGDSTAAGISLGPNWLNHLQLRTIELFLQSGKEANRIPLTVRTYTKNLVLNKVTHRFFRAAEYEFTLGQEVTYLNIEMTAAGTANVSLAKGGKQLGQIEFRSWEDLPAWFTPPTE